MQRWTTQLFLGILILLPVHAAQAKLWVVDNDPTHTADFQNAQEAQDAASDGDTIYFVGSASSYGALDVKKPLNLIGPGYFLTENEIPEANRSEAVFSTVSIYRDPDGGTVGQICDASGTTVRGIKTTYLNIQGDSDTYPITDISIIGNRFSVSTYEIKYTRLSTISRNYITNLSIASYSKDIIISNNIITGSLTVWSTCTVTITNNSLNDIFAYDSTFTNNILSDDSGDCTGSTFYNNLSSEYIGTDNGNISGVDLSTVYIGGDSPDGEYQLSENSVAEGAGANGEDLGAFGGLTPYVLSGRPTIPVVYSFTAPTSATATSGLPVSMSAKSRN